jgi:hypothetical protein
MNGELRVKSAYGSSWIARLDIEEGNPYPFPVLLTFVFVSAESQP